MPDAREARWSRYWDKKSRSYDREMRFWDRVLFDDSRAWSCSQASGDVLEVAIGTGLNLPVFPDGIRLTGLDISEEMLRIARERAADLGRSVTLRQGNAHDLPFDDGSFDTVLCTFGLCAIPDDVAAVDEMRRVLRPGGRLILVDHVVSTSTVARGIQRLLEMVSIPLQGEHLRRRPFIQVRDGGFAIEQVQRFKLGIVERLVARKAPAA